MGNPLIDNLPKYNYNTNMTNLIDLYKSGGNPYFMLNNMAMQNPNARPILNALNSGGNPKVIFEEMCRQRGINPQEFLQQLQATLGNSK